MLLSREATTALNEYLDRVRIALPLAPSHRLAIVDKLYRQIVSDCEAKANAAGDASITLDVMQAHLASLGSPEEYAEQLVAAEAQSRWPPEAFAEMFERYGFNERASAFAKAAAERGEQVARVSMDAAANALDFAAQKLREAADKLKNK